jgi:ferredoxin-NADP reductase
LERLAPSRAPITWRIARVVSMRPETATATTITLDVPDWPGHLAGQHVDVRLTAEDGYQAQRSYSIASPPEDPSLSLTIERIDDGEVSPYLADELRIGDAVELRGPIGGYFTWRVDDGGPLVLFAGGSGLVPLMAMLRHRVAAGSDVPAQLLVSARTQADVLYREELARQPDVGVDVRYTLTRETGKEWTGWNRRVDGEMLQEMGVDRVADRSLYVCGPTAFVERVAELLVGLGHDPHRVKTERFGPTGG